MSCDPHSPVFWVSLLSYCGLEYYLGKKTQAGSLIGVVLAVFIGIFGIILILKGKINERKIGD